MFIDNLLQPTHLLIILVVALIVLGPKRLPEAGRALGKGLRDFRDAMSGEHGEHEALVSPTVPDTPVPSYDTHHQAVATPGPVPTTVTPGPQTAVASPPAVAVPSPAPAPEQGSNTD